MIQRIFKAGDEAPPPWTDTLLTGLLQVLTTCVNCTGHLPATLRAAPPEPFIMAMNSSKSMMPSPLPLSDMVVKLCHLLFG